MLRTYGLALSPLCPSWQSPSTSWVNKVCWEIPWRYLLNTSVLWGTLRVLKQRALPQSAHACLLAMPLTYKSAGNQHLSAIMKHWCAHAVHERFLSKTIGRGQELSHSDLRRLMNACARHARLLQIMLRGCLSLSKRCLVRAYRWRCCVMLLASSFAPHCDDHIPLLGASGLLDTICVL